MVQGDNRWEMQILGRILEFDRETEVLAYK